MENSVSILGLGYVGRPLARVLKNSGISVRGTTRDELKCAKLWEEGFAAEVLTPPLLPSAELLQSTKIILNIPPFPGQLEWFKSWPWQNSSQIIFVSSTSVYEETQGEVSESSPRKDCLLRNEEDWIQEAFPRFTILRAGGILGPNRHPGNTLSGKTELKGQHHPVNLIHVHDLVAVIHLVMKKEITGIFNVVSDEHHSRKDFYQDYCRRHSLLLPGFSGDESSGKRVSNQKLKEIYEFSYPTIFGKDP